MVGIQRLPTPYGHSPGPFWRFRNGGQRFYAFLLLMLWVHEVIGLDLYEARAAHFGD